MSAIGEVTWIFFGLGGAFNCSILLASSGELSFDLGREVSRAVVPKKSKH